MKFIIFTIFVIFGYLCLGVFQEVLGLWVSVSAATAFFIAAVGVWLHQPRRLIMRFSRLRRPSLFEILAGSSMLVVVVLVVFVSLLFGPTMAEQVRKELSFSGGDWNGKYDEGGDIFDEADSSEKNGGESNNGSQKSGLSEQPEIRIPTKGKISLPEFPEVRVKPNDQHSSSLFQSKPMYIRMKTLNHFDGVFRWTAQNPNFGLSLANDEGWVTVSERSSRTPVLYRVTHSAKNKYLYALQGVQSVKLSHLRGSSEYFFELPPMNGSSKKSRSYDCISYPLSYNDINRKEKTLLGVGVTKQVYRENRFGGEFRERIKKTAAAFSNMSLAGQLGAVRETLRSNCTYSLNIENSRDLPPIQNFLYGDQEGFCLHFATATALLLRELGIPCRIATGYAKGTYFKKNDMWVFYTNNAHAWVEVKLEGYGWVVFDTTPPEEIDPERAPHDSEPRVFPTDEEKQAYWDKIEKENQNVESKSFADLYGRIFGQSQWILLVIVILLAILATIGIVQKLDRKKRRKTELEEDERVVYEEKKYLAMYRKICQINSLPMLSGDTLLAHVTWLEERNQKPNFADELLRYHYDTTYRISDVDKKVENDLIKLIKGWKL